MGSNAKKHVNRLGGTLHLDWTAAPLHMAAFRVGRVLHIRPVTRDDPVLCSTYFRWIAGKSLLDCRLPMYCGVCGEEGEGGCTGCVACARCVCVRVFAQYDQNSPVDPNVKNFA